jgi:hypothetical protein
MDWRKNALAGIGVGAVTAKATALAGTLGINAVGWTAAGVKAGSIAAGIQSGIGGTVAAGSTFATLQSVGAVGGLAATGPISLILGGAATGAFLWLGLGTWTSLQIR